MYKYKTKTASDTLWIQKVFTRGKLTTHGRSWEFIHDCGILNTIFVSMFPPRKIIFDIIHDIIQDSLMKIRVSQITETENYINVFRLVSELKFLINIKIRILFQSNDRLQYRRHPVIWKRKFKKNIGHSWEERYKNIHQVVLIFHICPWFGTMYQIFFQITLLKMISTTCIVRQKFLRTLILIKLTSGVTHKFNNTMVRSLLLYLLFY